MTSIWGFLLQTVSVSLVAALLLAVKALLADKLSPRWQYGVWSIFALRILLPVSTGRFVLFPVPLWIEAWKSMVEKAFDSAYSAVYTAVSVRWPVPLLTGKPQSITDWLFVLYVAGVLVMLLWYLLAYARLKLLLRRGLPAADAVQGRIHAICERHHLPFCRAVLAEGLPSAFVCGLLRPVLVLPAGAETDDKVLLHELLHLKHRDALQSVFWCVLRALHWCNPFLQYVFNRIGNDMESLCDQRVLEHLEGEERREYGGILLSMANERYPRAPGTTSLSNGGRNISRRIAAIVRFKKYPRGMALVSVCIVCVLAFPVLVGTAGAYPLNYYLPSGEREFTRAMALARVKRCTTVAGALDTYAKGLIKENGIYIATATSASKHGALAEQMRYHAEQEGRAVYHLDGGDELEYAHESLGYQIYNLRELPDGSYDALLAVGVSAFLSEDGESWMQGPDGNVYTSGSVLIPVSVRDEDGWVVAESAPRQILPGMPVEQLDYQDDTPCLERYEATGDSGTVTLHTLTIYTVNNTVQTEGWSFFGGTTFDDSVKTDAEFDFFNNWILVEYRFGGNEMQRERLSTVGYELVEMDSPTEEAVFPNQIGRGEASWSSSGGTSGASRQVMPDWDGKLTGGGGTGFTTNNEIVVLPAGYAVQILWNGCPVEEFRLGGQTDGT